MVRVREGFAALTVAAGVFAGSYHGANYIASEMWDPTDCAGREALAPQLGGLAINPTEEDHTSFEQESLAPDFINAHSELPPQAMVDTFLSTFSTLNEEGAPQLTFDEGIIPSEWEPHPDYANPVDGVYATQYGLMARIDKLVRVLSEYPDEVYQGLHVSTIEVTDDYEHFAGFFRAHEDKIGIEFSSIAPDSTDELRRIVTHELIGHAAHSLVCNEDFRLDTAISQANGGYEYIGQFDDSTSAEAQQAQYDEIPKQYLEYGPDRLFAQGYGARTVAEDVATVAEFTLETRGLIMPGDADYSSPLHRKQQVMVERLAAIWPGFEGHLEELTGLLRRMPTNEIYQAKGRPVDVPPQFWSSDFWPSYYEASETGGKVAVLNGAVFHPSDEGRGGMLSLYPTVTVNPQGEITYIYAQTDFEQGTSVASLSLDERTHVFVGQLSGGDLVTMSPQEWEKRAGSFGLSSQEADDFFANNPEHFVIEPPQE